MHPLSGHKNTQSPYNYEEQSSHKLRLTPGLQTHSHSYNFSARVKRMSGRAELSNHENQTKPNLPVMALSVLACGMHNAQTSQQTLLR